MQNVFLAPALAQIGTPVIVVVAANTVMSLDTGSFIIPLATNSVLDFGNLIVDDLQTNRVRVCGENGREKCTRALFRMYTSGTAGAIPANRNTVRISDFSPAPKFNVTADFTDAGAGSYSSTLVLEFGLATVESLGSSAISPL